MIQANLLTPFDIAFLWNTPHLEAPLDGYRAPAIDKKWTRVDGESMEVECGEFLWGLVRYFKPDVVVETGTYHGFASACIGLALQQNGRGHLWTIDIRPDLLAVARSKIQMLGMQNEITLVQGDSMSDVLLNQLPGAIDLLLVDGGNRPGEAEKYSAKLSEHGICLWHDAIKIQGVYEPVTEKKGKIVWAGRGIAWT